MHQALPCIPTTCLVISHTGCTTHLFTVKTHLCPTSTWQHTPSLQNPTGTHMQSTHNENLTSLDYPWCACIGHIVPALSNKPLLSIGQFSDAGHQVNSMGTSVNITYNGCIILCGIQMQNTSGIWFVTPSCIHWWNMQPSHWSQHSNWPCDLQIPHFSALLPSLPCRKPSNATLSQSLQD